MLTALDFWHLVEHIIPVYVIVLAGYLLVKFKVLQGVHAPGINRYNSVLGIPLYAFHLLAFNDPYQISFRLVGADIVQKAVALTLGCLWWRFAKSGSIDHLIGFYMLASLPNTVLIGDALLQPLYGEGIHGNVVTIIFLQVILWYNLAIVLYELRIVLLDLKSEEVRKDASGQLQRDTLAISSRTSTISIVVENRGIGSPHENDGGMNMTEFNHLASTSLTLQRTLSAPASVSMFSKVVPIIHEPVVSEVDEGATTEDLSLSRGDHTPGSAPTTNQPPAMSQSRELSGKEERARGGHGQDTVQQFQSDFQVENYMDPEQQRKPKARKRDKLSYAWIVFIKVLNRIKYAPLTHASIIGFIYSLLAYKFHWTMPYSIRTSVELISEGSIGMAIFILGMTWGTSGRLISCGWKRMTYGMFVRFLVGPIIMVVAALALGLRGRNFGFAVLQAVIPQGVISFIFAKEYNLHADEFSTAVIFQLIVFLPVVVVYYFIVDSVV